MGKCKLGTAVGGSVTMLQKYTVQQCIDSVRSEYPAANGFTMNYPCNHPTKCNCYAQFGMKSWKNHQYFKTCRFSDKGKYISAYYRIYYCDLSTHSSPRGGGGNGFAPIINKQPKGH